MEGYRLWGVVPIMGGSSDYGVRHKDTEARHKNEMHYWTNNKARRRGGSGTGGTSVTGGSGGCTSTIAPSLRRFGNLATGAKERVVCFVLGAMLSKIEVPIMGSTPPDPDSQLWGGFRLRGRGVVLRSKVFGIEP